jgi:hypothetical protein
MGITYMMKVVAQGPDEGGGKHPDPDTDSHLRPARPLSAVDDKIDIPSFPAIRGN